jgi:hypothetical protein
MSPHLDLHCARVEIGGTKGKVLTTGIKQIHQDFLHAMEQFQQVMPADACYVLCMPTAVADPEQPLLQVQYDVMDVDAKSFDHDFYQFRSVIKELERRLGAIIMQVGTMGARIVASHAAASGSHCLCCQLRPASCPDCLARTETICCCHTSGPNIRRLLNRSPPRVGT